MLPRVEQTISWDVVTSGMDAAESASPVEAVEAVTRELGRALGALQVSFLVADLSGRALVRLAHVRLGSTEGAPDGSAARARRATGGRGVRHGAALRRRAGRAGGADADRSRCSARRRPLGDRRVPIVAGAGPGDRARGGHRRAGAEAARRARAEATLARSRRLAHLLAFVVIANRRHTDLFEWGQRTRPLSLSAEIQQRLLPGPQTCEAGSFTLAGWLEPAASIAGDTFDFSLARDVLHLSLTDAMGHGVAAALSGDPVRGQPAQRPHRGRDAARAGRRDQPALVEHAAVSGLEDFVTGLLGRARPAHRLAGAGERRARRAVPGPRRGAQHASSCPWTSRSGCSATRATAAPGSTCEPGDRVVLLTDGMLERNAADRRPAGRDRGDPVAAPAGGGPGPGRPRAGRHRQRAQRRRHRAVPGLARRARTGPRGQQRSRPGAGEHAPLRAPPVVRVSSSRAR